MARKGFKVLDSDMHIIEPPDLWQRYIDPEFKDQAPRGLTDTVGDLRLIGPDGKPWGRDAVAVRDSKDRSGPVHVFTPRDWAAFVSGVLNGEFEGR